MGRRFGWMRGEWRENALATWAGDRREGKVSAGWQTLAGSSTAAWRSQSLPLPSNTNLSQERRLRPEEDSRSMVGSAGQVRTGMGFPCWWGSWKCAGVCNAQHPLSFCCHHTDFLWGGRRGAVLRPGYGGDARSTSGWAACGLARELGLSHAAPPIPKGGWWDPARALDSQKDASGTY